MFAVGLAAVLLVLAGWRPVARRAGGERRAAELPAEERRRAA